jgi:tripartite-type tricarboxylate transporter receptor subunit TctC
VDYEPIHAGTGGIAHITGRGIAPAIQGLVPGQIDLVFSDPIAALPQVRAGAMKTYGIVQRG